MLGHFMVEFYGGIILWFSLGFADDFHRFPFWENPEKKTSGKSMVSPCFPRNHGGEKVHDSSANATAWNVLQCHVGNLSVVGKTMENLNFFINDVFFSVRNLQNLGLLHGQFWCLPHDSRLIMSLLQEPREPLRWYLASPALFRVPMIGLQTSTD